jgi:glucose/arabinose dehydrogenase
MRAVKWILIFSILFLVPAIAFTFIFSSKKPAVKDLPKALINTTNRENIPRLSEVAENLHVPWGITFLPNGNLLVTERSGTVKLIHTKGKAEDETVANISEAKEVGEGGLLGIALHPDFSLNNFVYLYYTYDEANGNTRNRVSKFTYKNNKLINELVIVNNIPGARNHNGGRIKFGPDGFLYITTGDAQEPSRAQDVNSLAGKILKVTADGKAAPNNAFGNRIYSYGHRNPQGISWDSSGRLWATEHGRSGIQSGLDELNLIESGNNYGWPEIQGDETKPGMVAPVINSGPNVTWAPSGAAIIRDTIYFGGLKGSALYSAGLKNNPLKVSEHLKNELGRIRDIIIGPDGILYATTSNTDGRGNPLENDDRILKINPLGLD